MPHFKPLAAAVLLLSLTLYTGCDDDPGASSSSSSGGSASSSSSPAQSAAVASITDTLVDGRPSVEVADIQLSSWTPGDVPDTQSADFSAKLRLTEPHGFIVAEINKTNVVRKIADRNQELLFKGKVHAGKDADGVTRAMAVTNPGDNGWRPLEESAGEVTMAYPVLGDEYRTNAFRKTYGVGYGRIFFAFSQLKPLVEDGSPELASLMKTEQERQQKLQEQADARRRAQQEKAEADRLAREQKIREEKLARLRPLLEPFKNPSGAALITQYTPDLGLILTEIKVDDEKLTAVGKGIDLTSLPFKPFTFDAAISETDYNLRLTISTAKAPFFFTSARPTGLTGATNAQALSPLSAEERSRLDQVIAAESRLREHPPTELKVEILDAESTRARVAEVKTVALAGMPIYRNAANSNLQPLFAGNLANTRQYAWRKGEIVAYRLSSPTMGTSLLILGSPRAAVGPMTVTVNHQHAATVESIPRSGAVLIHLPPDTPLIHIAVEARGNVVAHAIALIP